MANTYERPRTFYDLRWNANALIFAEDHIDAATFRERLQFFALNAREYELKELARMVQL